MLSHNWLQKRSHQLVFAKVRFGIISSNFHIRGEPLMIWGEFTMSYFFLANWLMSFFPSQPADKFANPPIIFLLADALHASVTFGTPSLSMQYILLRGPEGPAWCVDTFAFFYDYYRIYRY